MSHPAIGRSRRLFLGLRAGLALVAPMALLAACAGSEKPQNFAPAPVVTRSVPEPLRNTVGAEATVAGIEPVLVSGYGFVVGLSGTGGQPLPERIAATMERNLGLNGISRANPLPGMEPMSPRELLQHPDTAVVIVQAAIPPGAPLGTRFDVSIQALNASSLEGGRLWTTELRIGPPAPFEGFVTQKLGTASGEVFQNPFREPGSTEVTSARILNGGVVTAPLELVVALDTPSHARARQITSAINSRFPADPAPTARGVSDAAIALRIPDAWADRPDVFLKIVLGIPVDWTNHEAYARRYVRAMQEDPTLAEPLSWCLIACNEREITRELYDSSDLAVLLAGLRAGVEMGDPLAADPLRDLAERGPLGLRAEAIRLLGHVPAGATIDLFLREQAASPDFVIRAAAYEALALRAETSQIAARQASISSNPRVTRPAERQFREEARYYLAGRSIHGISRRPIMGQVGAEPVLTLDQAEFGSPLVYVTMHAQPKITLFGQSVRLNGPLTHSMWNDRLIIASDPTRPEFRVYYRHPRTGRATTAALSGELSELIAFMARQPLDAQDQPGLGLSYSEIVGVLAELGRIGGLGAQFTTERDRLAGQILAATQSTRVNPRPETPDDVAEDQPLPGQTPEGFRPEVVPINPPADPGSR